MVRNALKRPITVMVLFTGLLLFSVMAVRTIPIDIFPKLNLPTIYVIESYGGMSPQQMEGFFATKFQDQFLYVSGVITERNVHPGDLVSAMEHSKPMLELKQTDILRLQVDIPESIAATLKDKDEVTFYLSAFPGKKMTGTITRKSENVNAQYRNERIEIDVVNKGGSLTPGMYADVYFDAKGDASAFFVPKSAVITSTERKYVLVYNNGKIRKIDVTTGNETLDSIQIYGLLKESDQIITNGNDEIEENH